MAFRKEFEMNVLYTLDPPGQQEDVPLIHLCFDVATGVLEAWVPGGEGKVVIGTHRFTERGHNLGSDGVMWPYPNAKGSFLGLQVPGSAAVSVNVVLTTPGETDVVLAVFRPERSHSGFMVGLSPIGGVLVSVFVTG